jgi:hypothetical protein
MLRRDPRIWRMAHVAVSRCLASTSERPRSIFAATAFGALEETRVFLEGIFTSGFGSAKSFIASVHNSMAGKLAVDFSVAGPNLTFCDGPNSLASAVGGTDLLDECDFPVLIVAIDEKIELLRTLMPHLSPECRPLVGDAWEEAAAAFMISRKEDAAAAQVRAIGPRFSGDVPAADAIQSLAAELSAGVENSPEFRTDAATPSGAGLLLHEFIASGANARRIIATHSPAGRACAVINVWR